MNDWGNGRMCVFDTATRTFWPSFPQSCKFLLLRQHSVHPHHHVSSLWFFLIMTVMVRVRTECWPAGLRNLLLARSTVDRRSRASAQSTLWPVQFSLFSFFIRLITHKKENKKNCDQSSKKKENVKENWHSRHLWTNAGLIQRQKITVAQHYKFRDWAWVFQRSLLFLFSLFS